MQKSRSSNRTAAPSVALIARGRCQHLLHFLEQLRAEHHGLFMAAQPKGVDQVRQDQANVAFDLDQALPAGGLLPLLPKAGQRGDDLHARGGVGGVEHEVLLFDVGAPTLPTSEETKAPRGWFHQGV